ncbi:hypothetical protein C8024_07895 [Sphingopyxis sp. BSNA05]|uniref:sulfotransferase family protein n=1 Tax=Sphingopyxis sp. BSNA05 TaxID=1236614 RepID=UPI0015671F39|nr:sulfotransferase [Sphingopyxis sp. BSNA05]NRD89387.1 hypothetical protein [Sphingopyxis sp. BSNA05]
MTEIIPIKRKMRHWSHRLRGWRAQVHPAPVFLLGHPKSGTTAIGSLLARATGLEVAHDLFQSFGISRAEAADLIEGRMTIAAFVAKYPYAFASPLQKCPKLTFAYPALVQHFPLARFALIARNPYDTIRSFLFRRGLPGDATRIERPLALLPEKLEGHYIDRLAHRWNLAAEVALDHPEHITKIRYEDFREDKIGEIARLADSLGLTAQHDVTPWLDIDYKPRSHTGTTVEQFLAPRILRGSERSAAKT